MRNLLRAVVAALLMFPSLSVAEDVVSWSKAITDVEQILAKYLRKSDELLRVEDPEYSERFHTPLSYAGNQYPHWYHEEHQCAILGRMLGKASNIGHLEPPLPLISAPLNDVWGAAMSLDTWINVAKTLVLTPVGKRAQIWNLECVGKYGIPDDVWDPRGTNSTFWEVDGAYIWIYGDITVGFFKQFVHALDANPEVRYVGVGSSGGSIRDAMLAGYEIRKRGLQTQLSGPCYSACPIVFLGGENRGVMRPFPPLGFHQIYTSDGPLPLDDATYRVVANYAVKMGADGHWLVSEMQKASPEDMNILGVEEIERDELCRRGVVTWYQGVGSSKC